MTIDFVRYNRFWIGISLIFVIGSVVALLTRGLNYGIDFRGGTSMAVKFNRAVEPSEIRKILEKAGVQKSVIQQFGEVTEHSYLISVDSITLNSSSLKANLAERMKGSATIESVRVVGDEKVYFTTTESVTVETVQSALEKFEFEGHSVVEVSRFGAVENREFLVVLKGLAGRVIEQLNGALGEGTAELQKVEYVGAKAGSDLKWAAVGSIFVSLLLIFLYVFVRFDLRYAPGAIVCLFHDVLITAGLFSLFQIEFDLTVVAALLTIVGYSMNDTIVIYDRVRENNQKLKGMAFDDLINPSVNQTVRRTLLSNGTTFLACLVLCILGGPVIFNFSLALTVGVVVGTYSTVYIACPVTVWFDKMLAQSKS